ncbi:MAG: thioredoxin family protein [Patescibacteria group bacterium]
MSEEQKQNKQQFLTGLFGGIAVVAVIGLIILGVAFISMSKNNNNPSVNNNQGNQNNSPTPTANEPATTPIDIKGAMTFSQKKDANLCKEDGKPVVYLFSTTWCPHCEWVKAAFDKVAKEYIDAGKIKAYHWEVDTNDDTLTSEKENQVPEAAMKAYQEFNPQGSIPTFVFGCKYFRVGNGYEREDDLAKEEAEFRLIIDSLIKQ